MLVATVSKREQAGSSCAEIDHGEEKGGKRIETEMRSKPRNPERKRGNRRSIVDTEESEKRIKRSASDAIRQIPYTMWRERAASANMRARAAVAISVAAPARARSTINQPPFGAWARRRMDGYRASSCLIFSAARRAHRQHSPLPR